MFYRVRKNGVLIATVETKREANDLIFVERHFDNTALYTVEETNDCSHLYTDENGYDYQAERYGWI